MVLEKWSMQLDSNTAGLQQSLKIGWFLEQFYIDKTLHKLHCIFFEFFWNREDSILSIKYINSLSIFNF